MYGLRIEKTQQSKVRGEQKGSWKKKRSEEEAKGKQLDTQEAPRS